MQALDSIKISLLTADQLKPLEGRIMPTFCFDNVRFASTVLPVEAVVYGYARRNDSTEFIEHAWLKLDSGYVDPTYQMISSQVNKQLSIEDFDYFVLKEFPFAEYSALVKQITGLDIPIVGFDFYRLRQVFPDLNYL